MSVLSSRLEQAMTELGLEPEVDCWEVGRDKIAVKHLACERIARDRGIQISEPHVLQALPDAVALWCQGAMSVGDAAMIEWAIGEATPGNTKSPYLWAMAEKRAKDRVILKLVGLHGILYSEEEADDFRRSQGDRLPISAMKKGAASDIWNMALGEVGRATTPEEFQLFRLRWEPLAPLWPVNYERQLWDEFNRRLERERLTEADLQTQRPRDIPGRR